MSKYVVPFINNDNWETNAHCELCAATDEIFHGIIDKTYTDADIQSRTDFLDKYYLVDGYNLLPVYEGNGYAIYRSDQIEKLKQYKNSNTDFMTKVHNVIYPEALEPVANKLIADYPTVLYSRWCKRCGSRKPDIYDPLRAESFNLLKIVNFKAEAINGEIHVTWRDSEAEAWGKTKLFRDGVEVLTTTNKDQYESTPFIEKLPDGVIYKYKVINYDFVDEQIQATNEMEVYVPVVEDNPPGPATNTKSKQIRKLYQEGQKWITKDVIVTTWDNPTDEDFSGNVLRIGEQFFVPANEADGWEASPEMIFEDYDINVGHTYYIKPFPYDRSKVKPAQGDVGYVTYRNYNLNSDYASIVVKQQLPDISNIAVIPGDGKINIGWKDPDDTNWDKTLVVYKITDGKPVLSPTDGRLIATITEHNSTLTNPISIDKLTNGTNYTIGIFPVSKDGLINVSAANQGYGIPGYYKDSIRFNDTNLMPYMGLWIPNGSVFTTTTETLCFFEILENMKYGGRLSFEYKTSGIKGGGEFNVYREAGDTKIFSTVYDTDWTKVNLDIEPIDYIKFMFQSKKGSSNIEVSLRNIRFDYYSYPKGVS